MSGPASSFPERVSPTVSGQAASADATWRAGAHIPVLDGIRGLAILLVVFFHQTLLADYSVTSAFDTWFVRFANIGWCGVDLFFVLSGFLITGILLDSKGSDNYFRNFYARRTLRIFPLYYAVVVFSLLILPNLPEGFVRSDKLQNFGRIDGDEIWYWTYLSNFSIAAAGNYRHAILDISWSLAIEEQFYILWPGVVLLLDRRSLMKLCVVLVVFALGVRVAMSAAEIGWVSTYVVTPARIDPLAIGAFLAAAMRGPDGFRALVPAARIVFAAGTALLLVTFVWRNGLNPKDPLVLTLGLTIIGLTFGGLLVMAIAARPDSRLAVFFDNRFMRSFGKYSYAIYLFHLPLRALVRDTVYGSDQFPSWLGSKLPGQVLFYAASTALVFVIAYASWHLFEKQFLKLKRFFPVARGSEPERIAAAGTRA